MRIVEVATFVAGPFASLTLGQLGADVIRVDPLEGGSDFGRWPLAENGRSLYWDGLNMGKRSVTLDLRSPEGRELLVALITSPGPDAGIVVTNALDRPWMGYESLRARRDDIIVVAISGHPDGRPAVDYTVNAAMGLPLITGPEDHVGPVNHVLPAWDLLTGVTAATGLLAAVRHRALTGAGQLVTLALADVALAAIGHLGMLSETHLGLSERGRHGNYLYGSFGSDFETSDGRRVMVVALTRGQWRALCVATGTSEVFASLERALNVDLEREGDRWQQRRVIAAILAPWFTARSFEAVRSALDAAHVLWGPYQTIRELVEHDPAYSPANPMMGPVEQAGLGAYLLPGSPLVFQSCVRQPARPGPRLGQHTDEVLAQVLGLSDAAIGGLHSRRVAGG
jgi:2-methylfumaryl-CoA isomerase